MPQSTATCLGLHQHNFRHSSAILRHFQTRVDLQRANTYSFHWNPPQPKMSEVFQHHPNVFQHHLNVFQHHPNVIQHHPNVFRHVFKGWRSPTDRQIHDSFIHAANYVLMPKTLSLTNDQIVYKNWSPTRPTRWRKSPTHRPPANHSRSQRFAWCACLLPLPSPQLAPRQNYVARPKVTDLTAQHSHPFDGTKIYCLVIEHTCQLTRSRIGSTVGKIWTHNLAITSWML